MTKDTANIRENIRRIASVLEKTTAAYVNLVQPGDLSVGLVDLDRDFISDFSTG